MLELLYDQVIELRASHAARQQASDKRPRKLFKDLTNDVSAKNGEVVSISQASFVTFPNCLENLYVPFAEDDGAKLSSFHCGAKLSLLHSWCQIVPFTLLVPNCPRCQIVPFTLLVPNCPGAKLS